MKTKYIFSCTLLACATLAVLPSCESKLDIEKNGDVGSEQTYYQTDDEALSAIAAVYEQWYASYQSFAHILNMPSDDVWAGGGGRGDKPSLEQLNEFTYDTENEWIEDLYKNLYTLIYKCNLVLTNVQDNSNAKKQAIAEAHFFRGYAYFYLAGLWGQNVPLVDHLLSVSEYRMKNSADGEVWNLVETDLKAAIAALPSKSGLNDQSTGKRITAEAAETMLGKAYLWQGKDSEAAAMFEQVIASNKYDLVPGSEYDELLHTSQNNCYEKVLEDQSVNDPTNILYTSTFAPGYFHRYECVRLSNFKVSPEAAAYMNTTGWGFYNPRKELYDLFVKNDTRSDGTKSYRFSGSIITNDEFVKLGFVLQDGKTIPGNDGYYFWKNRSLVADQIDGKPKCNNNWINHCYIRYAEVLLLAAEANVSINNGKAKDYVNLVRKRAGLDPLGSVTLDQIKVEKRLELCQEGTRYMDLIRWGDAMSAMSTQGQEIHNLTNNGGEFVVTVPDVLKNPQAGFKSKNLLLPYPLTEVQVNPNINQNPGW